jgi:DNA-binding transcriptional ArsR family regulator
MAAPTRSSATASPVRAPVRSVSSGTALPTSFDVRTAFDFALSLAVEVGEQDELPAEDKTWLLEGRAAIPASSDGLVIDDELCIFGAGLLVDHPEAKDAAGYVELLRNTSGRAFADVVLADTLRDPEHHDDVVAAIGVLCIVADRMAAWLPRYQEREARFRTIIERDVAQRAADRATLGPVELVERTTAGIRWLSEPGVRRLVLAPSYLVRPYNFTFTGGDWRIFVYPVADTALEPHDPYAPPVAVLRLHRALGDETRLRILRLLRDRDWYLTEIAERLDLSKPTIKHHLAQLRAAGLVTLTEEGGLSYFSLKRERLDDASSELKRYLV